jgi:hypothetical protein
MSLLFAFFFSITAFFSFPVYAANLLANPGFETGPAASGSPAGWWKYDGCGQESWAGRTGTNGMAFQSWTPGGWGGFGQDVSMTVAVGDVLTFSIWGLAETNFRSSTGETWLKFEYWTNGATAWTRQDSLTVYSGLITRPNQWNLYTFAATNTLPNVNLIKVLVGGGNFVGGNTAAVKWDDAELAIAPGSGNFPVTSSTSGKVFQIGWTSTTTVYYQVWSSEKLDGSWDLIRGMTLGTNGAMVWKDNGAVGVYTSLYYKIVAISVTNSHDQDGDGLSDVAELRSGGSDPAKVDTDGDHINDGVDPRPAASNQAPVLAALTIQSAGNFHQGATVTTTIPCSDADGDAIEYRCKIGAGSFSAWQSGNQFAWVPGAQEIGVRVLNVEARDPWGATGAQSQSVYIFRMPPQP